MFVGFIRSRLLLDVVIKAFPLQLKIKNSRRVLSLLCVMQFHFKLVETRIERRKPVKPIYSKFSFSFSLLSKLQYIHSWLRVEAEGTRTYPTRHSNLYFNRFQNNIFARISISIFAEWLAPKKNRPILSISHINNTHWIVPRGNFNKFYIYIYIFVVNANARSFHSIFIRCVWCVWAAMAPGWPMCDTLLASLK